MNMNPFEILGMTELAIDAFQDGEHARCAMELKALLEYAGQWEPADTEELRRLMEECETIILHPSSDTLLQQANADRLTEIHRARIPSHGRWAFDNLKMAKKWLDEGPSKWGLVEGCLDRARTALIQQVHSLRWVLAEELPETIRTA